VIIRADAELAYSQLETGAAGVRRGRDCQTSLTRPRRVKDAGDAPPAAAANKLGLPLERCPHKFAIVSTRITAIKTN